MHGLRYLHTMLRVSDLESSLHFYCTHLGMRELRRNDVPAGQYTLVFLGYADESAETVLELTYNYGIESYDLGTAFGHLAFGVPDIYAACDRMKNEGVTISRPPGPVKHGSTLIAFIEDPDGYKIELIQK